ncbi:thiamine pyrophosphate-dependent enzyme [Variovorax sp. J22R133]|uniref:thiamine pyrophosphate-dependent enzyme n=1 Tax=Variovorax brevis TaxID=3053503 RepID=UPI00257889C1|nr:thiamine pyrophosphate-dependent enzyme [Variovorax sp. J22R133]MDM0114796.1 thiamine pyrophosphate-dependent enzyme [Variovorax sp. J22R133]
MMNMIQACGAIAQLRPADSLLVSTMGAMFVLDRIEASQGLPKPANRINAVPLMGGSAGIGLGLALAQPHRRVIVVDGDASLLMELGILNAVAVQAPKNFLHIVIHNGTQFTGLANINSPHSGFSFAQAARNAGYHHAETLEDPAAWPERFSALLGHDGPALVDLMVDPMPQQTGPGFEQAEMPDMQFQRMGQEARALQAYLKG